VLEQLPSDARALHLGTNEQERDMRAASNLRHPENVTRPLVFRRDELVITSGPTRELTGIDVVEE
jgi:hypothetical protein